MPPPAFDSSTRSRASDPALSAGACMNVGPVGIDRGSYMYHGRVKALADAAREGGLSF